MKLAEEPLRDTPYLVIALETTGLDPDEDRVVELAAAALDPGRAPRRVLDTLIDPMRPVDGTRFHGLTAADLAGAPRFAEVWPALADAAEGRVLAFYDGPFGVGFLESEAWMAGRAFAAPWVDIRRLPRAGGFGPADWPLWRAGQRYGIARAGETQKAGEDALLAAGVLRGHLDALAEKGVSTFAALAARASGDAFVRSLSLSPRLPGGGRAGVVPLKPRRGEPAREVG